jgi:hypothetical protein
MDLMLSGRQVNGAFDTIADFQRSCRYGAHFSLLLAKGQIVFVRCRWL